MTYSRNWGSFSINSKTTTHLSLLMSFLSYLRFLGTSFHQIFLIPNSLLNIWWTVVWFKFNSVPIILSVNRWSACRRSWDYVDICISSWKQRPSAMRFIFSWLPSFYKCLKPPKHLGHWQNTVSIGLPKFCKCFHCTVAWNLCLSLSESFNKTCITKTTATDNQCDSSVVQLALMAYHMFTCLPTKSRVSSVAWSNTTLPSRIALFTHYVYIYARILKYGNNLIFLQW